MQTGITVTTATITGLAKGTTAWFVVKAISAGATSLPSNEVSSTPMPSALEWVEDHFSRFYRESRDNESYLRQMGVEL